MPPKVRIEPDEVPATFRPFARVLLDEPAPASRLVDLLGSLGEKAPASESRAFALLLRRRLPRSDRLQRITEVYMRERYPRWYIRAVNDPHRNAAYRRAVEALVTPRTLVFEAGTGSGLFAMLAARAGAAHVHTCERDPDVARIARENIARNGLEDRITVHPCRYEALEVGSHLPRRADLLLHEFVAAQFMVAEITRTVRDIRDRLLTPGAPILPSRFAAVGMLVGDDWPLDSIRVRGPVEGLDVGAINLLSPSGVSLQGPVPIECPLSAPRELAAFDLLAGEEQEQDRVVTFDVTAEGTVTGVLQWVRHAFPDGSAYENRPDLACNWSPTFRPLPEPEPVAPGRPFAVRVRNTHSEIFIDPTG